MAVDLASASTSDLQYDLGNLTAYDYKPIDRKEFGSNPGQFILKLARDNAQLLINQIFELPSESTPELVGRIATLPDPTTPFPREKPPPKAKAPTKWEAFAKTKGIVKRKKSRMEWDTEKQEYKAKWGYQRGNSESDNWVIEAKPNDDGSVDPWQRLSDDKKARVEKNKKQQLNNLRAASGERVPGTIDLTSTVHTTAPGKKNQQGKKPSKHHVDVALSVAQKSTASMGKFDKERHAEPTRETPKQPRRDDELNRSIAAEKKQSLSVLDRVLAGSKDNDSFDSDKAANLVKVAREKNPEGSNKRKGSSKGSNKGGGRGGRGGKRGGGGGRGGRGGRGRGGGGKRQRTDG